VKRAEGFFAFAQNDKYEKQGEEGFFALLRTTRSESTEEGFFAFAQNDKIGKHGEEGFFALLRMTGQRRGR
jgi:hypothetical protein